MHIRPAHSAAAAARMSTEELRATFLIDRLFTPGALELVYWETDRTIIGGAVPLAEPVALAAPAAALGADFFLQRRELGVINVGGPGTVTVDGEVEPLACRETLYIGRGRRDVVFASLDAQTPARFYLISYPAHAAWPLARVGAEQAHVLTLGAPERANARRLHQQIREGGPASCQLVMGYTEMAPGGVWNTCPPHTHLRRSEVYLYFDLPPDQCVFHFMGEPAETRHLVVRADQAVLSPAWSIHAGCGTSAYRFVWAMGGENQRFDDMDPAPLATLR